MKTKRHLFVKGIKMMTILNILQTESDVRCMQSLVAGSWVLLRQVHYERNNEEGSTSLTSGPLRSKEAEPTGRTYN